MYSFIKKKQKNLLCVRNFIPITSNVPQAPRDQYVSRL